VSKLSTLASVTRGASWSTNTAREQDL
jgi:hypothetical protein